MESEGILGPLNSLSMSGIHSLVTAIAAGARTRGAAGDETVDHILEVLTDGSREVKRLEMTDVARLLISCSTPFIIKWLSKKPVGCGYSSAVQTVSRRSIGCLL